MKPQKALKIISALAQETRINIFRLLVQESAQGLSAGKIAEILAIPPATLSFHLAQLTDAKLIEARREGRQIHYTARHKTLKKLYQHLTENAFHKHTQTLLEGDEETANLESEAREE